MQQQQHHSRAFGPLVTAVALLFIIVISSVSGFSIQVRSRRGVLTTPTLKGRRCALLPSSSSSVGSAQLLNLFPLDQIDSTVSLNVYEEAPSILSSIVALPSYSPTLYWFMFPVAILVAASCQLAGIGGAALFSPIFLLVFPLLGTLYPLTTASSAVASSLLTECFGFASGLTGYARRGLVDWNIAGQFLATSLPSALLGAAVSQYVINGQPTLLRVIYALLMMGLSAFLLNSPRPQQMAQEECDIPEDGVQTTTTQDGTEYTYKSLEKGSKRGIGATVAGGTLTGLLGVGIGEVLLPQLVRGCCMPLPLAAGTSVAVVVLTTLTAAIFQFLSLATAESNNGSITGSGLIQVIPWSLVQYTIPGVIIGGQLAPFLASRKLFSDETIESFAATLFGIVGVAFAIKAITG